MRNPRHQISPNRWSCLPTSFAMAYELPLEEVIQHIGHDGSEIIHPGLAESYKRRGFHPQELIEVGIDYGFHVTMIEPLPILTTVYGKQILIRGMNEAKIKMGKLFRKFNGVLTGKTMEGRPHAVCWKDQRILDPNGQTYGIDRFQVQFFFMVI
jgi:hypothetical protein